MAESVCANLEIEECRKGGERCGSFRSFEQEGMLRA